MFEILNREKINNNRCHDRLRELKTHDFFKGSTFFVGNQMRKNKKIKIILVQKTLFLYKHMN